MQSLTPPAASDAQPLDFAACFKLSTVDGPASMHNHRFRLAPPMGQFHPSGRMADLSADVGFPFLSQFLPHPK